MFRSSVFNRYKLSGKLFGKNIRKLSSITEPVVTIEVKNQVQWIRLNRPKQYNALNTGMFNGIVDALQSATSNPEVKFAVITGNGKFFCSGNDLSKYF